MKTEALSDFLVTFHEKHETIVVNKQWLQAQLLKNNRLELEVNHLQSVIDKLQQRNKSIEVSQSFYKEFYHSLKTLDTTA